MNSARLLLLLGERLSGLKAQKCSASSKFHVEGRIGELKHTIRTIQGLATEEEQSLEYNPLQAALQYVSGSFTPATGNIPDEGVQTLAVYQDGSLWLAEYDHAQNWWKSNKVSKKISRDLYGCETMMIAPVGWRYL